MLTMEALVDGARILQMFGDVATELLIRNDGDEAYSRPMIISNLSRRSMREITLKPQERLFRPEIHPEKCCFRHSRLYRPGQK